MDKLVELIGKILEKLTSAKLIWTIIIAIAIFALAYALFSGSFLSGLGKLNCLWTSSSGTGTTATPAAATPAATPVATATPGAGSNNAGCDTGTVITALGVVAASLILSAIIVWAAGLIKNKYFV